MKSLEQYYQSNEFSHLNTDKKMLCLLNEFSIQASFEGYKLNPISSLGWEKFAGLPEEQKRVTLRNFESYYDLVYSSTLNNQKMTTSKQLIWAFIQKMGLRPTSDLFSHVRETDIIEIYGKNFVQTFRNLNFFSVVSYSLIDIFVHEWRELFIRDESITTKLAQTALDVLSGNIHETTGFNVGRHLLTENFSENINTIDISHKYISPLYFNNSVEYFIVGSEAKVVSYNTPHKENVLHFGQQKF